MSRQIGYTFHPGRTPNEETEFNLHIRGLTQDEGIMFVVDALAYLNSGKPSAQRTDVHPVEPLGGNGTPKKDSQAAAPASEPPAPATRATPAAPGGGETGATTSAAEAEDEDGVQKDAPAAEDLTIFGRLTKLQDIIKEVQRRGSKTAAEVLAKCIDLRDAEVAPVLSRIADFETRVRTCCAAMKIPGAV